MSLPLNYFNTPTGTVDNSPITAGYQEALARQNYRGIASLRHGSKYLVFRTNPNSVMWSYKLNTMVENTWGGRVVQILSTSMEDLKIVIECGLRGWPYLMRVAEFMRNMIVDQRNGPEPGIFEYTTRGWQLKVYAVSIPFQDTITETTREIELNFKIQEDISGVITRQTVSAELAKLKVGVGFTRNEFNTGAGVPGDGTASPDFINKISTADTLTSAQIPAVNPFGAQLGNLYGLGRTLSNLPGVGRIFG